MRDLPPRPEVLEMLTMIVEARNEREWRDQAACKGMNPTVFFPERNNPNAVKQAKTVCATCPVSTQCGEAGQTEQTGIWGGVSGFKRQRSGVRKKSFEHHYQEWIRATEPSDEILAHDLGIKVGSVRRSRYPKNTQ